MTPIDDELRAALHGRAQVLAPSPDPLAGIERRARRMRRNRIGAAVAGSALAVAAVAAVVPALQSATAPSDSRPPTVASADPTLAPPTIAPTTPPTTTSYALDPEAPWAVRGTPVDEGTRATIQREYATRRQAAEVLVTPLFAQVYEPSQLEEVVFLAEVDGSYRWGVATSTESGPELLWDAALEPGQQALAAALPGDEVARLLVVASPESSAAFYGHDDASEFVDMAELAPGVYTRALEGDPATDSYRVDLPDRQIILPAPDVPAAEEPTGEQPTGGPVTALDPNDPWEVRGDRSLVTDGQLQALGEDWATRKGVPAATAEVTPLYVQRNESDAGIEVVHLVRSGSGPWSWGVSSLGEGGWWWYADNELAAGTSALAAALPGDEGLERLLVVGAPSLGGGMYAADGSDVAPMTDVAPGVFVTPISPGDADDRFMVLDGDGDLDDPVAEGPAPDFQNAG